ncbi:condensation domain-containing protein, partial [Streptomyces sp. NPDC057654]|uniref:condensation domain-containing protein n=1 Tax=Streptomyces sp. NPDC057654 TaxID=3346196 RepID=UPI0036CCD0A6
LPVTVNGKVDRHALPAPDFAARASARTPRTAAEETLCGLFAEVLGLERVGVDDSFFELGGDSIMSMQLAARSRLLGLTLTPRQVFEHKTPERLAALEEAVKAAAEPEPERGAEAAGAREVPWTPAMRLLGSRRASAQSMVVGAPAGLDLDVLRAGLTAVLDTHDMLRARTVHDAARTALVIGGRGSVDAGRLISRLDAIGGDAAQVEAMAAAAVEDAGRRLDPDAGVLLQLVWVDAGPDRLGRLVLVADRLAVDETSWRIVLADLAAACESVTADREPALEAPRTSFRRWAARVTGADRTAELDAWAAVIGENADPPLGRRALDPALDTGATVRRRSWDLPSADAATLVDKVPAAFHCGVREVLLVALAGAVEHWRRSTDPGVLVDVHIDGRGDNEAAEGRTSVPPAPEADLSRTVGQFTGMYPVRLDLTGIDLAEARSGGPAAGAALKAVKEQVRSVPGDGLGYGLLRHLDPEAGPALAALPSPQIAFAYRGRFAASHDATGPAEAWRPATATVLADSTAAHTPAAHLLEAAAVVRDTPDGPALTLSLSGPSGALEGAAAERLGQAWLDMLTGLAAHAGDAEAGGHTPSDFPLLDLDQGEVEDLEAELADDKS